MDTVWVTGGAGYIGSHVCRELEKLGVSPIVIDDFETGDPDAVKNYVVVEVDIAEKEKLVAALEPIVKTHGRPLAIIHLAAEINAQNSDYFKHIFYETNVVGTFNIAHIAQNLNVRRFVFASSAAVYGDLGRRRASTDSPTNPSNYYGKTKLLGERMLEDTFDFQQTSVLRYFNVAGANIEMEPHSSKEYTTAFFPNYAMAASQGLGFKMKHGGFFKGSPVRDFVHVSDVARITVDHAIRQKADESFFVVRNVGRGVPVPINKVPSLVKMKTKIEYVPLGKTETLYSVAKLDYYMKNQELLDLTSIFNSEVTWQMKLNKQGEHK